MTGRYTRVTKAVKGMKADAKRVRDKIRRDHESWLRIDAATVTSGEFSMQWLAERENDVSGKRRAERTLASNRLMVKRLCEVMGGVRLAETTPRVIEAALNEIRSGGKLSETTVYACYALICQLMNAAERNDLVLRNPCNRVEAPKKEKPKRLSLTSAQARELNAKLAKRESELWAEMRARRANVGAAGGARREARPRLFQGIEYRSRENRALREHEAWRGVRA